MGGDLNFLSLLLHSSDADDVVRAPHRTFRRRQMMLTDRRTDAVFAKSRTDD